MNKIGSVLAAMIAYDQGDLRLINHFLKVYGFAKTIGEEENLPPETLEILEIAALTHDIGIRVSEEKYHSGAGIYQQIEGPPIAGKMLADLGYPPPVIERVGWLIAHHHECESIRDIDHQILVEADFLVNAGEGNLLAQSIRATRDTLFRTKTGKELLDLAYKPDAAPVVSEG